MNSAQHVLVDEHLGDMGDFLIELIDLDRAVLRSQSSIREKFIKTRGKVHENFRACSDTFSRRYWEAAHESN